MLRFSHRHGANPDAVTPDCVPIIHTCVDLGHTAALLSIVRHNADVNRRLYRPLGLLDPDLRAACISLSCDYITPVTLAAVRGQRSTLRMLAEAGASLAAIGPLIGSHTMSPEIFSDLEFVGWISDRAVHVGTLQHLARLAVRTRLRVPVTFSAYQLPLPRSLMDYVAFCDLVQDK